MKTGRRTAEQIFNLLIDNADVVHQRRIAWAEFSSTNGRLWREAEAHGLGDQVKQMVNDWQKSQPAMARYGMLR